MSYYSDMSIEDLQKYNNDLGEKTKKYKGMNLDLNMARGKPCREQVDLSDSLINSDIDFSIKSDYRNYGILDGIDEAKEVFKDFLEVSKEELIIGGNSSLSLMYDVIVKAMLLGTVDSEKPWGQYDKIKFLCPVPGYDRHFAICENLGVEMINIDMDENGPDMEQVESLVKADESIKGIWCVPKYSNPGGITYSDEAVTRLATMETAAKDFRIFWDNAYTVHHLDKEDKLKDILEELKNIGNPNRVYIFGSTSKVTFPGGGIAMMGMSLENADFIRKQMSIQMIGGNKINQLMHAKFLPNMVAIASHMKKHAEIVGPKFDKVDEILNEKIGGRGVASWIKPNGGYFISLDVMDGCAKEVVALCKELGVTLTPAGATYPYKNDPKDSNIRIAPTFPSMKDLILAIEILCDCIEYVATNKIIGNTSNLSEICI